MRHQLVAFILSLACTAPATAQDDGDDFVPKLEAAIRERCHGEQSCMVRQRDAFGLLISLEPDSPAEVAFRQCVGEPLPSDADWIELGRCVFKQVGGSLPPQ